MRKCGPCAVLPLVGLFLSSTVAFAQAEPEGERVARAHFELGRELYESGKFEEAAREFEQAYDLSERHALLYNIYLAYRSAVIPVKALEALEAYLERVDDIPNRTQLEGARESLREAVEREREREAAASEATVTGAPEEAAPAPAPASESGGFPAVSIALMAVGGAAVIASVGTGLKTRGLESDLEDACPSKMGCDADARGTRNKGRTLARVTDGLLFSGLAVAGVGLVLGLVLGGDAEEAPDVALGCAPGGCAATLGVRY